MAVAIVMVVDIIIMATKEVNMKLYTCFLSIFLRKKFVMYFVLLQMGNPVDQAGQIRIMIGTPTMVHQTIMETATYITTMY